MQAAPLFFSEGFLRNLVRAEVVGDFFPFTTGSIDKVVDYTTHLISRLQGNQHVIVVPDRQSTGFSSYVEVRISKKDKSNTKIIRQGTATTEYTTGLLLYFSILAPYWFYGSSSWSANWTGGRQTGGSSCFLEPESLAAISQQRWQAEIKEIEGVVQDSGYQLLSPTALMQPAPAGLHIPTILSQEPYRVFDCFFYWED